MPNFKTLTCPSCGRPLLYDLDAQNAEAQKIVCDACGNEWDVRAIEGRTDSIANVGVYEQEMSDAATVSYIDDSVSALAFLENYFENYEWDDFNMTSSMSIPTVDKIVEKLIVKQGSVAATWQLQFMSIATPLLKKVQGLLILEAHFFDEFAKTGDPANGFIYFDSYQSIARKLVAEGDNLVKKMSNAIKYFKKYGGKQTELAGMEKQLKFIQAQMAQIKVVKSYTEMPKFAKAVEQNRKRVAGELAQKGIDAEQVYKDAVADFETDVDRRALLARFDSISGYRDANDYADKLDIFYSFSFDEGVLIRLGDKYYILRRVSAAAFNPATKGPEESESATAAQQSFSLFEIVDKEPQATPKVKNITNILTTYAGYLIYIKNSSELCIFNPFDDTNAAETVVLSAKRGDFEDGNGDINFFIEGKYLFVTRKLKAVVTEQKKGCFASLFKKPAKINITTRNNYELLVLDMSCGTVETAVPEMIDIMDNFDGHIFYTTHEVVEGIGKEKFFVYNALDKSTKELLDANTEIVDVIGGKVIYFMWTPNALNKDMYALDLHEGSSTLLDRNVFDYYRNIEGKAYYFVGNKTVKTLYSVNTDGTGKMEIMQHANNLGSSLGVRNGWLYLQKGTGVNAAIKKVRADGQKTITLCTQFKKLICFKDGYVYYVDALDTLRVVREDGTGNREVLKSVGKIVHISDDAIYLLKKERVGVVDSSGVSYRSNSLYKVDIDGHNLTKIVFDVSAAQVNEYNHDEFYLYKTNIKRYKISTPVDKDNYNEEYVDREIKSLVLFNTIDGSFTDVAVFGKPVRPDDVTFKPGCLFKKKITKSTIVEEVPNKITYSRKGKMKAGAIGVEQLTQTLAENAKK